MSLASTRHPHPGGIPIASHPTAGAAASCWLREDAGPDSSQRWPRAEREGQSPKTDGRVARQAAPSSVAGTPWRAAKHHTIAHHHRHTTAKLRGGKIASTGGHKPGLAYRAAAEERPRPKDAFHTGRVADPDGAPWTSTVIAAGESRRHGRDPRNLARTLCGEVEVTDETLYRACFYGTQAEDCAKCAERLPDSHY